VAPADLVGIVTRPSGALILCVTDDPGCPIFADSQRRHSFALRRHEHELTAHVLACVIVLSRPSADINQITLRLAAFAVLSETEWHGIPIRQTGVLDNLSVLALNFPELGKFDVPCRTGTLCAVEDLAIRWQLFDFHVLEPISAELRRDVLCSRSKATRAAHAMLSRNEIQVAFRSLSRHLVGKRTDHYLLQ
jgi:hypothetical protein